MSCASVVLYAGPLNLYAHSHAYRDASDCSNVIAAIDDCGARTLCTPQCKSQFHRIPLIITY